ncbi:HAD-like protein [Piromyces finnis]|uniref:Mitochondrial import inner membrane translocase subunit TIM50 n=1 Tax=Piromyces finnis TaxID=1754191 RepID=A0A1Y1V8N5_9FUNG|nr:HAD-like protein [Piromyces finnis]|eukprot:ORX48629.1 HAD-like protein [Piromyces finnis]
MSLIKQTLPVAKTAITNSLYPTSVKLFNNVNQIRLLNTDDGTNQKLKLKDKIKQSKIFNRKNKTIQYQSLRKEKKKSQKTSPPPSGSHPILNTVIFLGGAATLAFLFTGWPGKDDDPYNVDEWVYRSKKQIKKFTEEPKVSKILPDELPAPHCQPFTLFINLDDILVKSSWDPENGWHVVKRPGVDFFIQYLAQFYEIVIYSDTNIETTEPVINNLDPNGVVLNRLYNKDISSMTRKHQKDLHCLNRDIKKVIVLDSNKSSYKKYENNVVLINEWDGEKSDNELLKLIPFFECMAITLPNDIRPVIKSYSGKKLSDAFMEHQNILREKFNKQNNEILKKREEKKLQTKVNDNENGIVNALFGGRNRMAQEIPQEEESYEAPLTNPVDDMDQRRKNMRKAFFRQRSEWASMADEQRRLTMESIENQFNSKEKEESIKDINLE